MRHSPVLTFEAIQVGDEIHCNVFVAHQEVFVSHIPVNAKTEQEGLRLIERAYIEALEPLIIQRLTQLNNSTYLTQHHQDSPSQTV